jgi:hypothetical protein
MGILMPINSTTGETEANIVRLMTPGQAAQKGEKISPLAPLPLAELPPDFDFVASMSDGEKTEYIKSVLVRSEDEAIAVIAPALRFCGTAGSVVEAYLPLILEVKKRLCRPGRPKVDPATGERKRTWEEVCKENFNIGIRRMQQVLADLKEPKPLGKGGTANRRPPIDRGDYERARQVAAPARTLAEAVARQGLASKFPEALEILKLANIPVPDAQPAGDRVPDPDPGVMEALRQRVSLMADTGEIGRALETFLKGLIKPLLERHPYAPSSTITVWVARKSGRYIDVGDWVEYEGRDARLTEQAGQDKALGRVVGQDRLDRPRVRWHNGQAWGKPYSLIDWGRVRVLFDFQAAERFPEAYGSYPADSEGAPKEPSHDQAAPKHSVGPGSMKSGVEGGAGIHSKVPPQDQLEQAVAKVQAASPAPPQEAGPHGMAGQDAPTPTANPNPKQGVSKNARKPPASVKPKVCPPALSPEEEERKHGTLDAASGHPGRRQGDFVLKENGIWECEPEPGVGDAEEIRDAQPGEQQLPPGKPMATDPKPFRVKKRTKGDITDFLVIRDGDDLPEETWGTKIEAEDFCARLNASPVVGIAPQETNPQSAGESAA